jgi:hypothetical protein
MAKYSRLLEGEAVVSKIIIHKIKLHLFCSQTKKMEAYGYIKCLKKSRP